MNQLFPHHAALGQTTFKLKVGFDQEEDWNFVVEAARTKPVGTRLAIDFNQSSGVEQAADFLHSVAELNLLFAEEPIPANSSFRDWEYLALASPIRLAAGENVCGLSEFRRMCDAGIGFVQPDVAKWGGVTGVLDLAGILPDGVRLWPHYMGTAVGQIAALAVSACIGEGSGCEIDANANRLRTGLCGEVLDIVGGMVKLPGALGLAHPPLRSKLAEFGEISH
ncbi:MAG: hypothetical protein OXI01_08370 [Albidovulum sp.]|nr:hypothetical protein [Albidovulum sp.]